MRGRGKLRSRDARGRHWDPSGPDKAEWKTDECGEGGKEHGSTWAHILAGVHCQPPHHPPLSSHHSTIAPFLHSRANLSNSLLPEERTKREEEATKEGVFASLALFLLFQSFLRSTPIPRWVPSFISAYMCVLSSAEHFPSL